MKIFSRKCLIFFLFLLKTLIVSTPKAVLTSTHNLCFGAKNKKNIRKTCPCNVYPLEPHFYIETLNVGKKVTGKKVTEKKSQIWVGKKVTGKKVTKIKTFFYLLYV